MKILPLKPFYNVAANGQAQLLTTELGTLYSLHALHFVQGGGNSNNNTTQIYVKFAKQDIANFLSNVGSGLSAGAMLAAINTWKGLPQTATYVSFFFGNPELQDQQERHVGDIDLSAHRDPDGGSGTLEVYQTLGAGVAPTLVAWAEVEAPKAQTGHHPNDVPMHKAFMKSTPPLPNALANPTQVDIDVGATVRGALMEEFWFHGHLLTLEVKRNNVELFQGLAIAFTAALQAYKAHVATAGLSVYSPIYQGSLRKMISSLNPDGRTAASWNHLITTGAADQIDVYSEVIGNRYLTATEQPGAKA